MLATLAITSVGIPASAQPAQTTADDGIAVIQAATFYGQAPQLPQTVDGQAVDWDATASYGDMFNELYGTVSVDGTLADGGKAQALVEVVPEDIVYFVDAGTGKDWASAGTGSYARKAVVSGTHQAVRQLAGDQLLNTDSDQAFNEADGDTWGHTQGNNSAGRPSPDQVFSVSVEDGGTVTDKYASAMTSLTSDNFTYYFQLKAGTYTLTSGFHEMYSGKHGRTIQQKVTNAKTGGEILTLDDVRLDNNGSATNAKAVTSSGTFTLKADTLVKIAYPRGANVGGGASNENGVINWLAIAKGENPGTLLNRAKLRAAVAQAEALKQDGKEYASHSMEYLDLALERANEVLADTDGTTFTQAQIDNETFLLGKAFGDMTVKDYDPDRYSTAGVPVGETWLDTEGSPIQAHGGGFLQQTDSDGKPIYYWVGEDKGHDTSNFNGVSLYSSKDLVNWTFRNAILTPDLNNRTLTENKIERPKLVYNEKTKKYVLWGHWEDKSGYNSSQIVVATCDTVDGDYQVLGHWRPGADEDHRNWRVSGGDKFDDGTPIEDRTDETLWGTGSRDFTIFVDDDAKAYLVSAEDHSKMRIYLLNDSYTDIARSADGTPKMTYQFFKSGGREAPALSKIDGRYVMISSGQSGWMPNQSRYSSTKDITDPDGWTIMKRDDAKQLPDGFLGNNTTFYSQPTNIMRVTGSAGTSYVYMGDHWNSKELGTSTYVWLPLDVSTDEDSGLKLTMDYSVGWTLDAEAGTVVKPDVELLSQGKPASTDAKESTESRFALSQANDGNFINPNTTGGSDQFFKPLNDSGGAKVPFAYTVDLGAPKELSRADISFNLHNGSEAYYQYVIETSSDGQSWTQIVDRSHNMTAGFTSDHLTGTARYVRLNVSAVKRVDNNSGASWATGIVEFQVYGRSADAPEASDYVYYIDAGARGANAVSDTFETIAAEHELRNAKADQTFTAASGWGSTGGVKVQSGIQGSDATGLAATGKTLRYRLKLDAGTYVLKAGVPGLGATREMSQQVTWTGGSAAGDAITVAGNDMAEGTVTFTLNKATTVTYTLTRTSGANPTLAWLSVQR